VQPADWGTFFDDIDLLFVFASPIMNDTDAEQIKAALDKIDTTVLFASHNHEINSSFDIVLPMSLIAEKEGSITNIVGKVQGFYPALNTLGDCKPAWQFLMELGNKLALNLGYYNQFSSPESIREVMKKEISFFREEQ